MQHHDALINIPLIVIGGTLPFWIQLFDDYGWITTKVIIPTLTVVLLAHQIKRACRRK